MFEQFFFRSKMHSFNFSWRPNQACGDGAQSRSAAAEHFVWSSN